jgi:hypothetical protein
MGLASGRGRNKKPAGGEVTTGYQRLQFSSGLGGISGKAGRYMMPTRCEVVQIESTETIMFGLLRAVKIGLAGMAAAIMLISLPSASYADTGSVRIDVAKAGFIVGIGGGSCTLHFRGKYYPLSVGGMMSIGTIGAAGADLVGRAYNLRSAADIVGTYTAVTSSIAVAGGVKAARLQNRRQAGFEASLSLGGMNISMR